MCRRLCWIKKLRGLPVLKRTRTQRASHRVRNLRKIHSSCVPKRNSACCSAKGSLASVLRTAFAWLFQDAGASTTVAQALRHRCCRHHLETAFRWTRIAVIGRALVHMLLGRGFGSAAAAAERHVAAAAGMGL